MIRRPRFGYRADPDVPAFPDERPVIVYDGVCLLCSRAVRLVARRDPQMRFVAAQSAIGRALLAHFGLDPDDPDSWLLLEDGVGHGKARAVSRALRRMGGGWPALGLLLRATPRAIADWLYDRVARNRYRLFPPRDACIPPPPEFRARFIATGVENP